MDTSGKEDRNERREGKQKTPPLYCHNFDPELKKRCERIAGYLGKSVSDFVAEILEDETEELKEHLLAVDRWYAARQKRKKKARTVPDSPHGSGQGAVRRSSSADANRGTARRL
jgi:predicted DNA-binding protein